MGVQWGGKRTFPTCSAPNFTDQILGRRCVGGVAAIISNQKPSFYLTSFSWKPAQVLTVDHGIKMNVWQAINFGLNKLHFENIRENQRKVVEAYLSGRDVLMISPTGSRKSLTFHIAPSAIDFFKHGERDDIQTVCLVIFPLVSLMNDQVSFLSRWKRNQGCCCGSRQFRNWKQGSLRGQIQPCVHKPRRFNLFRSHRSTNLTLKNKIEAVFIDEGHCVAKWLLFYSFHLYIVRKLSVILLIVQLLFFCLKFAFVVFNGFPADISQLYTCKDWSNAVLCKSNESEIEIRPFANTVIISSGSENGGFGNSRKIWIIQSLKNCLFYVRRVHDVIAVISRQQYAN